MHKHTYVALKLPSLLIKQTQKLFLPDFDWPNAEVGQKMANSRLLFLSLIFSSLKILASVLCTSVLKW